MDHRWRETEVTRSRAGMLGMLLMTSSMIAQAAFPDARNAPPAGWQGPVFRLSQNYPRTLPQISNPPWLRFDFKEASQAPQYMNAVLNYCLQGNTANNFADVSKNSVRKWYHAPWLHVGEAGREFIHGMTRERPSRAEELGPLQTTAGWQNWAVGFYNSRGGYTLGRVWANEQPPDASKAVFPLHTVSCKLIFTAAPLNEVPFLTGSLEWEADINRASGTGARPTLRLLQIDIAVRDARADTTTGWVLGTFQYEQAASTSGSWWRHMVPVGLMWGNDAPRVLINQPPREQWINPNRGQRLHLGLRGLLNGPIDNPRSSCVGCHGLAQIARVDDPDPALPRVPTQSATVASLQRYLRNIGPAQPFSPDYVSLDYSLQLEVGINNFLNANASGVAPSGVAAGAAAPAIRPTRTITRDEE